MLARARVPHDFSVNDVGADMDGAHVVGVVEVVF